MDKNDNNYPIDFVVTWVDGNDPEWQKERQKYAKQEKKNESFDKWNNNEIRFRDWGTLKYWFRGVEKYAPWVRYVFFVTNGQVPEWLNTENPKLKLVKHSDYMKKEYLPTFNSNAIELNLHHIKDLAEHFVYFNDDVFIINPIKEKEFFIEDKTVSPIALNCVALEMNKGHSEVNNTKMMNKYFKKNEVISKNKKLWFSPKNGIKQSMRTLLLTPWDRFPGFYDPHLESAHMKSVFEEMWKMEGGELNDTCMHKFRTDSDYSHWLFKNYNWAKGNVVIKSPSYGKMFIKHIDEEILSAVKGKKYKIVCINDIDCSEKEFVEQKKNLLDAFDEKLPDKSSFEK